MVDAQELQEKILATLLSGKFGDATGLNSSNFHIYVGTCELAIHGRGIDPNTPQRNIANAFVEALGSQLFYDHDTGHFPGSLEEFETGICAIEA